MKTKKSADPLVMPSPEHMLGKLIHYTRTEIADITEVIDYINATMNKNYSPVTTKNRQIIGALLRGGLPREKLIKLCRRFWQTFKDDSDCPKTLENIFSTHSLQLFLKNKPVKVLTTRFMSTELVKDRPFAKLKFLKD